MEKIIKLCNIGRLLPPLCAYFGTSFGVDRKEGVKIIRQAVKRAFIMA